MAIVTRSSKGMALTFEELDGNFTYINTTKVEKSGTPAADQLAKWTNATTVGDAAETIAALRNADNHTNGTNNKLFTATERTKLAATKHMKVHGTWQGNEQSQNVDNTVTSTWEYPNRLVVEHNIGHTNYMIICQPENDDGAMPVVTDKSANTATIRMWKPNGIAFSQGFYLVIYYT